MNPLTLAKIALRALLRNRMRTFLSVLGIVIGVAAVITMVAMGEGSRQSIKEQMTSMGTNAIIVMPNWNRRGGVQAESSEMLEEKDVIAIRENATYINGVSPMITVNGQAIVGNNNSPTTLSGISADYLKIRNYEIEDGVMFDDATDRMAKVCVIGQTVVKNLFAGENPIGKTIRYKSIPLKVIGTLKSKGSGDFGQDNDDVIFTPYQTVMRRFSATTNIRQIYANSIGEGYAEKATAEIMTILKERRNWTKPTDPFRVFTQEEMIQMVTSTSDMLALVLTVIAGISYRTHQGNRTPHGHRRSRARHLDAVPVRIGDNQPYGRRHRDSPRGGGFADCKDGYGLAHDRVVCKRNHQLCRMLCHGSFFRVVSGPQGQPPGPHRSTKVRVMSCE